MLHSLPRFIEMFKRKSLPFVVVNGVIWYEYSRMFEPLGPVAATYSLPADAAKNIFDSFPGSVLIRYSNTVAPSIHKSEWYAVVADKFVDLTEMNAKLRNQVKRGLGNCVVRRITAQILSDIGYDVYLHAYYNTPPKHILTRDEFRSKMLRDADFHDLIHYWGVFKGDVLIGYSINWIYDSIEANYSVAKFHNAYLDLYPSYALFYTMNQYYLVQSKMQYVNDGFRNLYHKTNIQDFLQKKMGFTKLPAKLMIHYRPYIALAMRSLYPLRSILGKLDSRVKALFMLESMRRSSENATIL